MEKASQNRLCSSDSFALIIPPTVLLPQQSDTFGFKITLTLYSILRDVVSQIYTMRSPLPAVTRDPSSDHAHFRRFFSNECWCPVKIFTQRFCTPTRKVFDQICQSTSLPSSSSSSPHTYPSIFLAERNLKETLEVVEALKG